MNASAMDIKDWSVVRFSHSNSSLTVTLDHHKMVYLSFLRAMLTLSLGVRLASGFGLTEDGDSFVVDTSAGLIFTGILVVRISSPQKD